jgi:peroxiredoxin
MAERMKGTAIVVGDRVRFTKAFLQSTVQYTGPEAPCSHGPFAKGTVMEVLPMVDTNICMVAWDGGDDYGVLAPNLEICR